MNPLPSIRYSLTESGAELLDRVEPLWLQLRHHHADISPQWSPQLLSINFAQRRAGLIKKADKTLLVLLASAADQDVGYCVSSITSDQQGEIDSLYVLSSHRCQGIGNALMSHTLEWFHKQSISSISLEVIVGNDSALPFYARYGFLPRTVCLRLIKGDVA
jgi:ribosomal protein S18 acetylase RimI-like enzyme